MNDVQKAAVKELLHLLVDKEESPVVLDLLSKLPAPYASMAAGLAAALIPVAVSAEDALIEKI